MVARIKISEKGPEFSRLCYGAWRIADRDEDKTPKAIRSKIDLCLEYGVTTFDHADIYGDYSCEEYFGGVLAETPSLRDKMEIVSKAGIKLISNKYPNHKIKSYDTGRDHLTHSVESSLRKLRTDYLDLFLIHRPSPMMDADETAGALNDLVKSGKVKHVGVSNFTSAQFQLLDSRMNKPLVTNQVEVSPLMMDALHDGTIDLCQRLRISPMAWSPLGGGMLFTDTSPNVVRLRGVLEDLGKKYDMGVAETAVVWLLTHPSAMIPVVGSNNVDRMKSMFKAVQGGARLTTEEWFEVWQAAAGVEVP